MIGHGVRVAALVIGASLTAGEAAAADDAAVAKGAAIARAACAPCHAIGTSGASPRAEAPAFRDLGRRYPLDDLEEALAEGVVVGHPDMPEVKMSEPDVAAFVAWLKTIQTP